MNCFLGRDARPGVAVETADDDEDEGPILPDELEVDRPMMRRSNGDVNTGEKVSYGANRFCPGGA